MAMQVPMMFPAQWNGEFVADLASEGSGLRKLQMVRIAWCSLTDQAGLRRNEGKMRLVSLTNGLAQGRHQFVRYVES